MWSLRKQFEVTVLIANSARSMSMFFLKLWLPFKTLIYGILGNKRFIFNRIFYPSEIS